MWFIFAVLALLSWSGSDLFSKLGCRNAHDKYSHLKMLTAVGFVMGAHSIYQLLFSDVHLSFDIIVTYLPVSCLYILSMAIGYLGLKYIELSISSPICNSSGAIVAVLALITSRGTAVFSPLAYIAITFICIGVISLGITEYSEDENIRIARQSSSNYQYSKSIIAILLPLIYCLLDALGTFADSKVLELIDEDSANCAYELTFLFIGIIAFIYTRFIKKQTYSIDSEGYKYVGAVFETIGQFFYVYALADTNHVAFSAPIISSYCVVSVIWSRIFLKERLSVKHYISIGIVLVGIVILGILDF